MKVLLCCVSFWHQIWEYGITSILIQIYLDSEAEKYSCSLYLKNLMVPAYTIFDFNQQWYFRQAYD